MKNEKKQIAGNNSNQTQIETQNIIINNGITTAEVKSMLNQQYDLIMTEFTPIAKKIADERIEEFKDVFLPDLAENKEFFELF